MKHIIEVENVKCGGCINTINKAISALEGVDSVSIDLEKETVFVEGTVEREVVAKKLYSLGYPEKGENNLLKKAQSYVSCAVGKMTKE